MAEQDISYDRAIFASNLKRLMAENNERQVDIARLLGVSKATVSAYCSGIQMARMDKIEALSLHFGVSRAELIEEPGSAAASAPQAEEFSPAESIYRSLNEKGQGKFLAYGRMLSAQEEFSAEGESALSYIKHYIVPAAAGYASPIEGEDYENILRPEDAPPMADFCIDIRGDSMEPYIRDGQRVYVRRDSPLKEFEVGVFFVDGDVFCKQWCVDYSGTLHLLSANPKRQDANISISRSSGRSCVCFGKVLLSEKLPQPVYE